VDAETGKRLLRLKEQIVANFDHSDWQTIGLLTGYWNLIGGHSRLLRSLSWGDEDYAGNVMTILLAIQAQDPAAIAAFEEFVESKYPGEAVYVSAKPAERKILFSPNVFSVPELSVEADLVAVMMPFGRDFDAVLIAIREACAQSGLRCMRVDDLWEESSIVQDIFNLVFRAQIVVVDFTGKNPNVMYETGIAHTLGKHVVPISQSLGDVPFDLTHHRVLTYLNNQEGLGVLGPKLAARLATVSS